MVCENCGSRIDNNAERCLYCGFKTEKSSFSAESAMASEKKESNTKRKKLSKGAKASAIGVLVGILAFVVYLQISYVIGSGSKTDIMECFDYSHGDFHEHFDDVYECVRGSGEFECATKSGIEVFYSANIYSDELVSLKLEKNCTEYQVCGFYIGMTRKRADKNAEAHDLFVAHEMDMEEFMSADDANELYGGLGCFVTYWPDDNPPPPPDDWITHDEFKNLEDYEEYLNIYFVDGKIVQIRVNNPDAMADYTKFRQETYESE